MDNRNVFPRQVHPQPLNAEWKNGTYEFGSNMTLYCNTDDVLQLEMMQELWSNFSMGESTLEIRKTSSMPVASAVISDTDPKTVPQLVGNFEYTVNVTKSGFELAASDSDGLTHAFFTVLQLFHPRSLTDAKVSFTAPICRIEDRPVMNFRGIHLCVFPETSLLLLNKAIKMAGFMKFTHVILEFWGTLQYDVMPELCWKEHHYTKEEIRPLINMARGMGMQVIPMYNHLGHAASSRVRFGRHVVLNQNPKHALLFEPDGWTWCLSNPKARDVLKAVRRELIDLCGPGDYFFIGCDEAYSFASCDLCSKQDAPAMLAQFINDISEEMEGEGRRVMMWGDALLRKSDWKAPYGATGNVIPEALSLLGSNIVIADWQYHVESGTVETAKHFMEQGFDTLLCPWDKRANIRALTDAAKELDAFGVLATTWDRLPQYILLIPSTGSAMWSESYGVIQRSTVGSMLRKLILIDDYKSAGWNAWEVAY